MKTTFLIFIPIQHLILYMQSGSLSIYLLTGNFNKSYFKHLLKLGIHVIF